MNTPAIPTDVLRAALESVQPGEVVLVNDVVWDLKSPCDDCPFMRTSPYHGGVAESLPGMAESIMERHEFSHSCHKTDCRPSVDGPQTWQGAVKHCAGALMMLLKTGKGLDLQGPLLDAASKGKFDVHEMTRRAKLDGRVFKLNEMMDFYQRAMARRMRNYRRQDARRRKKAERRRRRR